MRDTILASLFLASATLTSASRLECLHTRSLELASYAACGDEGSLNYCFSHLPLTTQSDSLSGELERCFVSAGCTVDESRIEAVQVFQRCDTTSAVPADLRRGRRQFGSEDSSDNGSDQPDKGAKEPFHALLARVTAAMQLPRETPGVVSLAARQDTATTTGRPASPSPCFTDTTTEFTSCPTQSTGTDAGKKLSCFLAVMATPRCRDGVICKSDAQGNPSCMWKNSSLGLDGIIISAIFAGAIAVSIIAICFMCCRERSEHRRIERAAEAARIAKEAKTQATVAGKRAGQSVTGGVSGPAVEGQPLMSQGVPHGGPPSPGLQGGNPFSDGGHDGHPMR
ncbi:uncharacterized protein C8A04DRAFT_9595 [Dichotomopilus funicola]|uniref:Uncharacterized protein n=1 Tax=Dichotomopilus funicola TaxID=1934379 RepID=A0AAN6ZQH9_9PEZI|nr:hypothetical protein C8A04DRAFT_9595 [Dichotomopilus funicola]